MSKTEAKRSSRLESPVHKICRDDQRLDMGECVLSFPSFDIFQNMEEMKKNDIMKK